MGSLLDAVQNPLANPGVTGKIKLPKQTGGPRGFQAWQQRQAQGEGGNTTGGTLTPDAATQANLANGGTVDMTGAKPGSFSGGFNLNMSDPPPAPTTDDTPGGDSQINKEGPLNLSAEFDKIMGNMENMWGAQKQDLNRRGAFQAGAAASQAGRMGGGMGAGYMSGQRQAQNNLISNLQNLQGQQAGQMAQFQQYGLGMKVDQQNRQEKQTQRIAEQILQRHPDMTMPEAFADASGIVMGDGGITGMHGAVDTAASSASGWKPTRSQSSYWTPERQSEYGDDLRNNLDSVSDLDGDTKAQALKVIEDFKNGLGTQQEADDWFEENVPGWGGTGAVSGQMRETASDVLKTIEEAATNYKPDDFKELGSGGYKRIAKQHMQIQFMSDPALRKKLEKEGVKMQNGQLYIPPEFEKELDTMFQESYDKIRGN